MNYAPTMYVYCYDCSDDKRRRRVYELLREYGEHIQYSVFRCTLSDLQRARLDGGLAEIIAPREDQVLVIRLGKKGSRREWPVDAIGRPLDDPDRSARII